MSFDEHEQRWKEWKQIYGEIQFHSLGDGWNECHEGPNCTLDLFWSWVRNRVDPMIRSSKQARRRGAKTLVRGLWLSVVNDQLNFPNLCCLEEVARRKSQLVEAYESGAHGKPDWSSVKWSTSVNSSSDIVPVPVRRRRRSRLRTSVCVPPQPHLFFEDEEWECLSAPQLFVASLTSKGKGKKEPRQLEAAAAKAAKFGFVSCFSQFLCSFTSAVVSKAMPRM